MTNLKMEEKFQVFCLVLIDGTVLISKVEELYVDIGKPDCKLINPFVVKDFSNEKYILVRWLEKTTSEEEILINSDKIITIVQPKGQLFDEYMESIK